MGACIESIFTQVGKLPSERVKITVSPAGMALICQTLPPPGLLTVPLLLLLMEAPALTVTDTDQVERSAEQAAAVDTLIVGSALTFTVIAARSLLSQPSTV